MVKKGYGGTHSGWAKQYITKPTKEIEKGIKSFEKQIKLHHDKINNPRKHTNDWDNLRPAHQQDLMKNKWPSDIARHKELKNILEGILRGRNEK